MVLKSRRANRRRSPRDSINASTYSLVNFFLFNRKDWWGRWGSKIESTLTSPELCGQNERTLAGRNHPPHHHAVVGQRTLRAPAQNCGFGTPASPRDDRCYRPTAREKPAGAASSAQFPESLFTIRLRPAHWTATRPQLAGKGTALT